RAKRAEPVDPAALPGAPLESIGATDPAEQTLANEAFMFALVVALERLPARQRAVLTLREVFGWRAREGAELFGVTVASVNSLLQRARASLEPGHSGTYGPSLVAVTDSRRDLLASFLASIESRDRGLRESVA